MITRKIEIEKEKLRRVSITLSETQIHTTNNKDQLATQKKKTMKVEANIQLSHKVQTKRDL